MALGTSAFILIAAFLGGVTAIMALLTAFAWSIRSHGRVFSLHFGGTDDVKPYREIELLDSAVRDGRVCVRYRNTGKIEIAALHLKVKVFDAAGELVEELDEFVYDYTAAGAENQNLVDSEALVDALAPPGRSVTTTIHYGQAD